MSEFEAQLLLHLINLIGSAITLIGVITVYYRLKIEHTRTRSEVDKVVHTVQPNVDNSSENVENQYPEKF